MKIFAAAAVAAALFTVSPATAAVLVNGMPTGTLAVSGFTSNSYGQNFLVKFTLATAADITGFEFLESIGNPTLGQNLRIKIRTDANGSPAATNAYSFVDQIDAITAFESGIAKVTTNFSTISLAAGTYWMGASGDGNAQTWATYDNGKGLGAGEQWQLSKDTLSNSPSIYQLAFNVLGASATPAVPEPATWAMMMLGFGGMGYAMRRRPKVSTRIRFA